jgi:hypothetical protein
VLPTDVDDFAGDEPTTAVSESLGEVAAAGSEVLRDWAVRAGIELPPGRSFRRVRAPSSSNRAPAGAPSRAG